jgi:hypothetical protein
MFIVDFFLFCYNLSIKTEFYVTLIENPWAKLKNNNESKSTIFIGKIIVNWQLYCFDKLVLIKNKKVKRFGVVSPF